MAEAKGFEPLIPFQVCRFSRPEPSTTRPPLRILQFYYSNNFTAAAAQDQDAYAAELRSVRTFRLRPRPRSRFEFGGYEIAFRDCCRYKLLRMIAPASHGFEITATFCMFRDYAFSGSWFCSLRIYPAEYSASAIVNCAGAEPGRRFVQCVARSGRARG